VVTGVRVLGWSIFSKSQMAWVALVCPVEEGGVWSSRESSGFALGLRCCAEAWQAAKLATGQIRQQNLSCSAQPRGGQRLGSPAFPAAEIA
jgi:hypothetical protein